MGAIEITDTAAFDVVLAADDEMANIVAALRSQYPDAGIWQVRGSKMGTLAALFDELGAALQFPYYFGENWAALHDCLLDLSWQPAHDHLLVVTNAHLVLEHEPADAWVRLVDELRATHDAWSGNGTSFRTIFHAPPAAADRLRERLRAAGLLADAE